MCITFKQTHKRKPLIVVTFFEDTAFGMRLNLICSLTKCTNGSEHVKHVRSLNCNAASHSAKNKRKKQIASDLNC